jgi:tetratricopeptide (TPR) repeat protein
MPEETEKSIFKEGIESYAQRDYRKAIRLFEQCLKNGSGNRTDVLEWIASAYHMLGDTKMARRYCRKALSSEGYGAKAQTWADMAWTHWCDQDSRKAMECFEEALGQEGITSRDKAHIYLDIAWVELESGNFQESKKAALLALAEKGCPQPSVAWLRVAAACDHLGEYEEAIRALGNVLKSNDCRRQDRIWLRMGSCYRKLGHFEKSIHCLKKALDGDNPSAAWREMGVTYLRMKNQHEAMRCFERALQTKEVLPLPSIDWRKADTPYRISEAVLPLE